jgi:hypothetical protein
MSVPVADYSPLHPYRFWLFTGSIVGLPLSVATLYFLPDSRLGFYLIGPLCGFPWFLGCAAAVARSKPARFLFIGFAIVPLLWPFIIQL